MWQDRAGSMALTINNKCKYIFSLNIFFKNGTKNQAFRFVYNLDPHWNTVGGLRKVLALPPRQCQKHQLFYTTPPKKNQSNSFILKACQQNKQLRLKNFISDYVNIK